NGMTWDPVLTQNATNLSQTANFSFLPRVVASGPNVYVAWLDSAPASTVMIRASTDGGAHFGNAQTLGNWDGASDAVRIVAIGSSIHAVWQNAGAIFYRSSVDAGLTWNPPLNAPAGNLS